MNPLALVLAAHCLVVLGAAPGVDEGYSFPSVATKPSARAIAAVPTFH